MKIKKIAFLCVFLGLASALFPTGRDAAAQTYPTRPVRMVVTFSPGGGADTISRIVAIKLGEKWGHPVVIDNRPGANGVIGADLVAKSKPDGYTLLVQNASHAINPALYSKLPYNNDLDLIPVTVLSNYPFILTINPSLPAKTFSEFIALAKKRPGEMSYASPGNGSAPHLGFELLKNAAGIDLVHVPYKGAGPANVDLVSGQVQAFINNILAARAFINSGRIRVLAVTSTERSKAMPDVPTIAESGLPGFDMTGWNGVFAPAGTPKAIVTKIQVDISSVLQLPEVKSRLLSEATEPGGDTSEEFTKLFQAETKKWANVMKIAGVKPL